MPKGGSDVTGASPNAQLQLAVLYGPDPRSWGRFRGLSSFLHRGISGAGARPVIERDEDWSGYSQAPQFFAGLAGLASGASRAVSPRTSQLSQEKSAEFSDPAQRILYDRMARGQR